MESPAGNRRGRWRRWCWAAVAIPLALFLSLVLLAHLPAVRREALRRAEGFASQALGREVRAGSATLHLWQGRLELSDLRMAAGTLLADRTLLAVERVQAHWDWTALLHRAVIIRDLRLIGPRLALRKGGEVSVGLPEACALLLRLGGGLTQAGLQLERAAIERGQVVWAEGEAVPWSLAGVAAEIQWAPQSEPDPSAAVSLRIERLAIAWPSGPWSPERISLRLKATATEITVVSAEAETGGGRLSAAGRVALTDTTPRLDLTVKGSAPLASLLGPLGVARRLEGTVNLEAQVQGPWDQPSFRGQSLVTLGAGAYPEQRFRFAVQGSRERLELETREAERSRTFWGRLVLDLPAGSYAARLKTAGLDLTHLTGLPAVLADLFHAHPPSGLAGRLTADLNVAGQGTQIADLRGRGSLLVEEFRLSPDLPAGRLETRLVATESSLTLESLLLRVSGTEITGRGSLHVPSGRLDIPLRASLRDVGVVGRGFGVPLLGGQASLTGRLTGTLDDPRAHWQLLWREPRIATVAFDRIEGEIEVTRRTLRTSHLDLRLGQTLASLRGSVTAPGTVPLKSLDPKRDLHLDLTGQIAPGRTADLAPLLPIRLPVQGAFRATGRITGTPHNPTGEIALRFGSVQVGDERWQQGVAALQLLPEAVEIGSISLRRGTEELTGNLRIGRDESVTGALASTSMDLTKIGILAGTQLAGQARFRVTLEGSLRETRVAGEAVAETLTYRNVRFGPATATFAAEPKGVEVNLVAEGEAYRMHLRRGMAPDRRVDVDLALADADLLPLLRLGEIDPRPITTLRGSGRIRYWEDGQESTLGGGEAELDALQLRIGEEVWGSREAVSLHWRGKEVRLRQVHLRSGEREVDISGQVGADGNADLGLSGRLPLTVLAPWLGPIRPAAGVVTASLTARGPLRSPDLTGTATLADGRFTLGRLAAPIQDASAAVDLDGSRIRLRSFSGRCAEGTLTGDGEVLRQGSGWSLRFTFHEAAGRAEQLLATSAGGQRGVTGQLTAFGTLESNGTPDELWRNLDGTVKFSLEDGRLGRGSLLAQILALLNIRSLVQSPGAGSSGEGMPYRRMRANVTITDGVARTEDLVFQAAAVSASAVGHLDLLDETLEFDVAVRPFQNVDSILTKIPLAGWLLGGKEKGLIIAYYKVTGTLSNPTMTALPLASLGRDLFGVFRRLLDIPEALLGPSQDPASAPPSGGKKGSAPQ